MEKETHESSLKVPDDYVDYAIHFANICNRMAHLYDSKYITIELVSYFDPVFAKCLALIEWLKSVENNIDDPNEYGLIKEYCKDNSISPDHEMIKDFVLGHSQSSI